MREVADSSDWREWAHFAENDWLLAARGLADLTSSAVVLLHSSAEKYLKAVLVARGRTPERTHDLEKLLGALGQDLPSGSLESVAAKLLTGSQPPSRYPDDLREPDAEEALALARAAEVLREFARSRLGLVA